MIKKYALVIAILALAANTVFAAGSLSISSVSVASSVTQGDSFSLTVYVSGTEATGVSGTLTLPSGLSCTPTSSQTISLDGSGSGSGSWTCSADVAGDYTNQITASVSATDSGTGGSLSDSEQTGLSVLTSASLVATSTITSSSVAVDATSSMTVAVHNAGDESTTYSVAMTSSPTGATATLSSGSASGTISGGSVSNIIYSLSSSTAGTYTVTATVTGGNSQIVTTSQALTVTASSSSSSSSNSSSSSSAGGGGGVSLSVKKTVLFDTITPGVNGVVKNLDSSLGVTQLLISVNTKVSSVTVSIDKLSAAPSTTGAVGGKAYKYLAVEKTIDASALKDVTFSFAVEKSWIINNSIDENKISLYRYTTKWDKLTTTKTGSNDTHITYEAVSPGLSYFAISGESTVAECTSGQKQCYGDLVQECSSGTWTTTQTCSSGCENAVCKSVATNGTTETPIGSECTSGSKRCLGNEVQECAAGTWVRSIVCSLGCNADKLECNPYTAGNETGSGSTIPMDYLYVGIVILIVVGLGIVYFKYFKNPGEYHYKAKK